MTGVSLSQTLLFSAPAVGLIISHHRLNQIDPEERNLNRMKIKCPTPINAQEKTVILNQFKIERFYNLTATVSACFTIAELVALLAAKTFSLFTSLGIMMSLCLTLVSVVVTAIDTKKTNQDIQRTLELQTA